MTRWIFAAMVLALLTGCQQESVQEAKQKAYQRWYNTRATVLVGVASDDLKSGQLDQAQNKAQEAVALDPSHVPARTLLGKIYIEQGRYSLAINELKQTQQSDPRDYQVQYLLGIAYERDGKLQEALECYRSAAEIDNKSPDAIVAQGEVLVSMGKVTEAQQIIDSHMQLAGNDPAMFELAGRIAMMRRDFAKAAAAYQQACEIDDENPAYREATGRAQYLAGDNKRAVETLRPLTENKAQPASSSVYCTVGDCYFSMNRVENARQAYEKASQANPQSALAWVSLAKVCIATRDYARGIYAAQKAASLDEELVDAQTLLGYALIRDGKTEAAVGILRQAVEQHPENPLLHCLLGEALAGSGQTSEAVGCYHKALTLEPESRLARQLLAKACGNGLDGDSRTDSQ